MLEPRLELQSPMMYHFSLAKKNFNYHIQYGQVNSAKLHSYTAVSLFQLLESSLTTIIKNCHTCTKIFTAGFLMVAKTGSSNLND